MNSVLVSRDISRAVQPGSRFLFVPRQCATYCTLPSPKPRDLRRVVRSLLLPCSWCCGLRAREAPLVRLMACPDVAVTKAAEALRRAGLTNAAGSFL